MLNLGSTLCFVCLWHFLFLPTMVCACNNSCSTLCVVCLLHFLVLPTVVCACDNFWFLLTVLVACGIS